MKPRGLRVPRLDPVEEHQVDSAAAVVSCNLLESVEGTLRERAMKVKKRFERY